MYSRIVVGTDGTDRSLIAVDHAARLAAAFAAELHVVAAARMSDASAKVAAKIGHDVSKRHGVRVVEHPRVGEPAVVLMAVADAVDADLIVIGNKSTTSPSRTVTGSLPIRLAHHCGRPLLIVHTG
jgi:nucleotide-binding universal stress UspA family protein